MMELPKGRIIAVRLILFLSLVTVAGIARAADKNFLWRVQSDKGTVYILGSVHFLKKENYPLKKTIEKAFDNTKKLVLEVDLKGEDAGTIQRLTLEKGINHKGTLQQSISPETYDLAEKRAQELGIDIRALSPLKPWVVALTMTALQLQKLGFDPSYGVDRYLTGRAAKSGKAVAGLETASFQIGLIDRLPERDQEAMLRQSLKEMDLLDRGLEQIVRAWSTGDTAALESLLLGSMREYPAVHQTVIVNRNHRWLPQIEKMIERGESTLIAVGAAHLIGKDGIIELLKARGYTVEQL